MFGRLELGEALGVEPGDGERGRERFELGADEERLAELCTGERPHAHTPVRHELDEPKGGEAAKRLAYELHGQLAYADIDEVFKSGLHEYLTSVLEQIAELGDRIQRAYLGAV